MEKTKMEMLSKYLTENDIDPFEAIKILEEVCRQIAQEPLAAKEKAIMFQYEKR